jgi:hypothetical protein
MTSPHDADLSAAPSTSPATSRGDVRCLVAAQKAGTARAETIPSSLEASLMDLRTFSVAQNPLIGRQTSHHRPRPRQAQQGGRAEQNP